MAENIGWLSISMADLGSLAGHKQRISPDIYSNKNTRLTHTLAIYFACVFMNSVVLLFAIFYPVFNQGTGQGTFPYLSQWTLWMEYIYWVLFSEYSWFRCMAMIKSQYGLVLIWWVSLNSSIPWKYGSNLKFVIFKLMPRIDFLSISFNIGSGNGRLPNGRHAVTCTNVDQNNLGQSGRGVGF